MKTSQVQNIIAITLLLMLNLFSCTNVQLTSSNQNTSGKIYPTEWLNDFWIGVGYSCAGKKGLPEDVNINYKGDVYEAFKVHGTPCVPSGEMTFTSKIQSEWDTEKHYPCTITSGTTTEPSSIKSDKCQLHPIDQDHFEILPYGIQFKRGRLPDPNIEVKVIKTVIKKKVEKQVNVTEHIPCQNEEIIEVDYRSNFFFGRNYWDDDE